MQPKFLHYFLRDIKETSRTSVFSINQKLDTRLLTYSPGQIYVNLAGLKSAEAEIDWGQYHLPPKHGGANFKDVAGTGKPFEEMEQIFLLKHDGTKDNRYLHDVPHYFMIDSKTRLFENYAFAFYYAMDRRDKSSTIWQYSNKRLYLLHHFSV